MPGFILLLPQNCFLCGSALFVLDCTAPRCSFGLLRVVALLCLKTNVLFCCRNGGFFWGGEQQLVLHWDDTDVREYAEARSSCLFDSAAHTYNNTIAKWESRGRKVQTLLLHTTDGVLLLCPSPPRDAATTPCGHPGRARRFCSIGRLFVVCVCLCMREMSSSLLLL